MPRHLPSHICHLAVASLLALSACGDPIEREIQHLIEGGDEAERAKMALNLAKAAATDPLIRALQNRDHPPGARADIAEAIYRLYLREEDEKLIESLIAALEDPAPEVRIIVARALGDLKKSELVEPLIALLEREADNQVHHEILIALENLGSQDSRFSGGIPVAEVRSEEMTEEQRTRFIRILRNLTAENRPDSLAVRAREWLEVIAEEKTVTAHNLVLQADLEGAENLLHQALALVPDSKNINYKLGRFYYDNGEPQKGIALLDSLGFVARIPHLKTAPQIDGKLDEDAWNDVVPLTDFYQCIWKMGAYAIEGRAEVYLGQAGEKLYFAVKGYEPSTASLVANTTQHDGRQISRDDCVEIFFDVGQDYRTFHHIIINSLATYQDKIRDTQAGYGDLTWEGVSAAAASVSDTYWAAEIELPFTSFTDQKIAPGTIWGFNVARVRIGNAAEYGQWIPTYGSAHRPDRFGFLIFD